MILRLVISAKSREKAAIRRLVESIQRWETSSPDLSVNGILVQTEDPQISQAELDALCATLYPAGIVRVAEVRSEEPERMLHLGSRGVSINGKTVGICEGLVLTLGNEVSEDEEAALKNGTITLSRMGRG